MSDSYIFFWSCLFKNEEDIVSAKKIIKDRGTVGNFADGYQFTLLLAEEITWFNTHGLHRRYKGYSSLDANDKCMTGGTIHNQKLFKDFVQKIVQFVKNNFKKVDEIKFYFQDLKCQNTFFKEIKEIQEEELRTCKTFKERKTLQNIYEKLLPFTKMVR